MRADVPRRRSGERPQTTARGPRRQLTQRATPELWGRLIYEATRLPHVREARSAAGDDDARALVVADRAAPAVPEATLAPGSAVEPVHLHGVHDTSIRLVLPAWRASQVCADGWGAPEPYAAGGSRVLVYGPRDPAEVTVVLGLIAESIAFARGARVASGDAG